MRLAYLFSRYPIVSQTFCDTEILALEKLGVELELYSIYPPPTSFRHGHAARMHSRLHYAPSSAVLKLGEERAKAEGRWPWELIAEHEAKYGPAYKSGLRARNALYFADLFCRRRLTHFHVHFANRAAHTAIFLKKLSGIPFSISTHGQDFMSDLGSDELLREICSEAAFVANETNFSKGLVSGVCPDSAGKMYRVFNGMDLDNFPPPAPAAANGKVKIVSIGRLIEFKGFHHLIPACAALRERGLEFECDIIGEGPWREPLQACINELHLREHVHLRGALPQEEVFAALRGCDIFALACTTDEQGATDVFPTVILEAMASAKPVVSTRLAGVPEQIVDGESGLLVEPGDEMGLSAALAGLISSRERRRQVGQAARARLTREFSVEQTVRPLHELFVKNVRPGFPWTEEKIGLAALTSTWPPSPSVEREIRALREAAPALRVYAAEANSMPWKDARADLASAFEFLPDGMVLEGEWQQERELARRMETWRAELGQKLSSEVFLQQARRALYLRRYVTEAGLKHLHVLDGRELLTGWLLHRLTGITLSVTLEQKPPTMSDTLLAKLAAPCLGVRGTLSAAAWANVRAELETGTKTWTERGVPADWAKCVAGWGARGN